MPICFGRRLIVAAIAFLIVGGVLNAADPPATGSKDPLDESRRRDEVAQQKAEADFRAALLEMNKLENANPGRAVERLKKMLAVLDDDITLSPTKRTAWQRVLKDRIRVAEAAADRIAKAVPDEPARGQEERTSRQAGREGTRRP